MNRLAALIRANPRRALVVLSAAAIASFAAVGSGADFNAVSARPEARADTPAPARDGSKTPGSEGSRSETPVPGSDVDGAGGSDPIAGLTSPAGEDQGGSSEATNPGDPASAGSAPNPNSGSPSGGGGDRLDAQTLRLTNSKENVSLIAVAGLRPGGPAKSGSVVIRNAGNSAGIFRARSTNVTDSDSANPLSVKLDVKVEDLGDPAAPGTPVTKYAGKLGEMPALALGTYSASEAHRYRFTVSFPDGGTDGADNAYQGDNTTFTYRWESTAL